MDVRLVCSLAAGGDEMVDEEGSTLEGATSVAGLADRVDYTIKALRKPVVDRATYAVWRRYDGDEWSGGSEQYNGRQSKKTPSKAVPTETDTAVGVAPDQGEQQVQRSTAKDASPGHVATGEAASGRLPTLAPSEGRHG